MSECHVVHKWEGHVLEVGDVTFAVRLVTLYGDDGGELIADVRRDKIHPEDTHLLRPGAGFYWIVEECDGESKSELRFRRIPPIRGELLERMKSRMLDLLEAFRLGGGG